MVPGKAPCKGNPFPEGESRQEVSKLSRYVWKRRVKGSLLEGMGSSPFLPLYSGCKGVVVCRARCLSSPHLLQGFSSNSDFVFLSLLTNGSTVDCACMEPRLSFWEITLGEMLPSLGTLLYLLPI